VIANREIHTVLAHREPSRKNPFDPEDANAGIPTDDKATLSADGGGGFSADGNCDLLRHPSPFPGISAGTADLQEDGQADSLIATSFVTVS
jgi:hypothetical protein